MNEIQEIEARLSAATPGPWSRSGYDVGQVVYGPGGQPDLIGPISTNSDIEDAEFIAHAPEDIRALLDEVKAVKAAVQRHPDVLECSEYGEDEPISCGWKSAYRDVVWALNGGKE